MGWNELIERYKEHNDFMLEQIKEKNKELSELRKQNKCYRKALEFYADKENYCVRFEDDYEPILQDKGKTARQALEG